MVRSIGSFRRILSIAVLLCLAAAGQADAAVLVKAGKAVSSIVVPAGTTGKVQTAAQDLASYLHQMSGATVPVVTDAGNPSGYKILIGSTTIAPVCPSEVTKEKAGYDGFIIKSVADGVVIAGRNDEGTVNGVYHFAEEVLGIHWYSVEDDGPTVPKRSTVKIPSLALTVKPDSDWRGQYFSFEQTREAYSKKTTPFANKLHANRDRWWVFNRLWGTPLETGHIFSRIVPADLFDTHPEYFPYLDYTFKRGNRLEVIKLAEDGTLPAWPWKAGRQKGDDSVQRCLSNPDVIKLGAEWTAKQFEKDPSVAYVSLSPNDGPWWCECDGCKAMGATRTERTLVFANAIAKANEAKYPDRGYIFYAYWDTIEPPKDLKAHRNVVPMIAPLWNCVIHPISSNCPDMIHVREIIQGWKKSSPRISYRPYMSDGFFTFPGVLQLAEEMRYVRDAGGVGGYREYQFSPRVNWQMLSWMEIKLLWDIDSDPVKLRKEFIKGYYGKTAAKPIERVYDKIEKELRNTVGDREWPADDGAGLHSLPAEEILRPVIAKCQADIDASLKAAESSPEPFRGRIVRDMETLLGKNTAEF